MSLFPDSGPGGDGPPDGADHGSSDRVDSLVAWINEIDSRLRVAEVATGDEKTAKELRKAVEAAAKYDPKLEERLGNRVDVLADRLATLATTVSTTAAAIARKDGEIAALHRELEESRARVDVALAQAGEPSGAAPEIDRLREELATLSAATEQKLPRKVDGRIDDLKGQVVNLAQRLETLSSTVSTTASSLAGREGELAALKRTLDGERAGLEVEVAKLRAAVDPLPIEELRATVKTLSDGTRTLERDAQRRHDAVKGAFESIAQRVEALTGAVASTTRDVASGAGEVEALRASFEEESGRVDSLLMKLHQATGELSARVAELGVVASSDTVDELGGRLAELSTRVEALAGAVKETAAGYADKEYEIAALGRRFEEISAQVDAGVRDLREAVSSMADRGRDPELEKQVETLAGEVEARVGELARRLEAAETADVRDQRVDGLTAELAAIAERLAALDGASMAGRTESAAAVAALEGRIAALGEQLEQAREDDAVTASQVTQALRAVEVSAEERVSLRESTTAIQRKIAELARRLEAAEAADVRDARVDELRTTVEREIAELARRLEAAEAADVRDARVDGLVAELAAIAERLAALDGASVAGRAESAAAMASLQERMAGTEAALGESAAEIASLREAVESATEGSTEREAEVRGLGERFLDASRRVDSLVGELQTALETMPGPVNADAVEERLGDLAARLDDVEQTRATAALEIARASAAWSDERTSIREELASFEQATRVWAEQQGAVQRRLEALAEAVAAVESRPPATGGAPDELVQEILGKIEHLESERQTLSAEIAGATAFWSSGLGALEARLSEVAAAKDDGVRKVDDEVVRALFDLARRLDVVERSHASGDAEINRATESWAAEREFLAAGLDELTRRLDALDEGGTAAASTSSAAGEAGDGRFRLELRALELRMDHAEVAARENREAVLVQLERLATRIEWRLQRLETGNVDDPLPQVANGPLAQVVQLRGTEA